MEYLKQIKMHMFKCTTQNHGNCVVKFVERYCEDAHKAMFDAGYAPKVVNVGSHGRFKVITMKEIEDALTVDNYVAQNPTECNRILLDCSEALNFLHSKDYCHGDFRPQNILVSSSSDIKIIDFDWAGKSAKYPLFMNHASIKGPNGVEDGKDITKEHDLYWLETLKSILPTIASSNTAS